MPTNKNCNPFHPNDPLYVWVDQDLNKHNYKDKWEESKKKDVIAG